MFVIQAQEDNLLPASKSHPYLLAPNDVVDIKIYHEDDLETKARISQDGTISFPFIGVVAIGGKTIEQARTVLREMLDKKYLINPQITLMVVEYSKRRFTILGQVQKPGAFEIPSEESVTLLEAIAMAGGYTRLADPANVRVARMTGDKIETVSINAKKDSNAEALSFQVLPDDTVNVPERLF